MNLVQRGLVAGLAALVLTVAGCGDDDSGGGGKPPADFIGIVAQDVYAGDADYREETLKRLRDVGVGIIRQRFDWSLVEKRPGRYGFEDYDPYVEAVARHGLQLLPILFEPPRFRSSRPAQGAKDGTYPPSDPKAMGDYAVELVKRYGPGGSFWRENPDVPAKPIRSWQVWNEPNLPQYWPTGPDAREYGKLLRPVHDAIKREDPDAEVVTAGLADSARGVPLREYAITLQETARGAYDTLAIHPYATTGQDALATIADTRDLLGKLDVKAPIWATEFGWATKGPPNPYTIGPQAQSEQITYFLDEAAKQRKKLGLKGIVYYGWTDLKLYPGGSDFFGLHTGLLRQDGTEKPGFEAFRQAVQRIQK